MIHIIIGIVAHQQVILTVVIQHAEQSRRIQMTRNRYSYRLISLSMHNVWVKVDILNWLRVLVPENYPFLGKKLDWLL